MANRAAVVELWPKKVYYCGFQNLSADGFGVSDFLWICTRKCGMFIFNFHKRTTAAAAASRGGFVQIVIKEIGRDGI